MPDLVKQCLRSCGGYQRYGGDDREQQQSKNDPVDDEVAVVDARGHMQIDRRLQTEPEEVSQGQAAAPLAPEEEQGEREPERRAQIQPIHPVTRVERREERIRDPGEEVIHLQVPRA